ncbi:transglycosylase family protein [Kitasatospora sp. SUK 42]|uniref:transglycosylase family protein n=1 Tax=Kitasatospora sp. SUK 42 TaxID=1588882 RepID=UPI0027393AD7|nr:transglycosylase family protein [Kitasatospora sp. SUK 42]
MINLAAALTVTMGPLSLLAAQQASAASVATWDKVAQCESSGDWTNVHHTSTTTYYGGLQFDAATWNAYGGQQYAPYANQATKMQQILIAEKVLAVQGERAWPHCGPPVGLGADHATPYPATPSGIGVYRKADRTFYVADRNGADVGRNAYGNADDMPLVGHFAGPGRDTVGVYRPETQEFFLTSDNTNLYSYSVFGNKDDVPLVGDWDGTGKQTIGVYRPSEGAFYLTVDNLTPKYRVAFGNPNWKPVVGNWSGTGKDTVGVYDPDTQTFHLSYANVNGPANDDQKVSFGNPDDVPIKGDWDGSGTDKVGVYRPSTQEFFGAVNGGQLLAKYGNPGDKPITGHWK